MSETVCAFCNTIQSKENLFYNKKEDTCICLSCIEKAKSISDSYTTEAVNIKSIKTTKKLTHYTPSYLISFLDEHVVGHHEAKKQLSMVIYSHIIRSNADKTSRTTLPKSNVLILGETGTGKTLMLKKLSELLSIPLVVIDATTITQTGYYGDDVSDCIKQLMVRANGDVSLVENGIVFIDEVDKLAATSNFGTKDISGRSVQQSFLKMIEGKDVEINTEDLPGFKGKKQVIRTENILFVAGGAFDGMMNISKPTNVIGFTTNDVTTDNETGNLEYHLKNYGMLAEFISRFPIKIQLGKLSVEDIVLIIRNFKDGVYLSYKSFFNELGIKLTINHDIIQKIAEESHKIGIGARGIQVVLQPLLDDLLFKVLSRQKKVSIRYATILYDSVLNKFISHYRK